MSKNILIAAYRQVGIPLDQLPYCEEFARLRKIAERESGEQIEERALWKQLVRMRKDGELPRLGR